MLPPSRYFPPAEVAGDEGLLCVGGRLSPEWLLDAYSHGIFPWPMSEHDAAVAWWSPDPRAIFELGRLHVSRRLARTIASGKFTITRDRDFAGVIQGCATAQRRKRNTWITSDIIKAYTRLHKAGAAHSVEAWYEGKLAGGVYGVAFGGLFAGESMFHHVTDASKVALAALEAHLRARGYRLFDIQQLTPHTESLGATEISREAYLKRLAAAVGVECTWEASGE